MVVPTRERQDRASFQHPARLITGAFAGAVAVGTAVLALPIAATGPGGADLGVAAFTAVSAVTVTGLAIVDTGTHWSAFGEAVILALVQVGGIGIMTLASLVLVAFSRRMALRHRVVAQAEVGVSALGELRNVLRGVVVLSLTVEALSALTLTLWFAARHAEPPLRALWLGTFHAVSAFNNAGFALYEDSLVRFVSDPVVNVVVMVAIVLGGLGIPVLSELGRDRLHWRRWTLHTKLVVTASAALLVAGWLVVCVLEWTNRSTFGGLSSGERLLAALFHSVSARTAGFNTVDVAVMSEGSWLATSALMLIGAAPASTGGGIKVTTFAMLAFVILSEVRGDRDVTLFSRRIPVVAQRQALAIALIGVGVVFVATLALTTSGGFGLGPALFEVTSAFGTVGLSTGVTAEAPPAARVMLALLMFAGRVGPLTVGAALALRSSDRRFRYPEERPLLG